MNKARSRIEEKKIWNELLKIDRNDEKHNNPRIF